MSTQAENFPEVLTKQYAEMYRLAALMPEVERVLENYLEWGAMTSSDRDLWAGHFRALLAKIQGA